MTRKITTMSIAVTVVLAVLAVAVLIVGALAWTGRLPGNSVIGLRVPEVRRSKDMWVTAHRIAGPMWVFAGVLLAFAAAFSSIVSGWGWIVPVALVVGAVAAIGAGAGRGAHTVAALDARRIAEESTDDTPKVDLDALRRAAKRADD